MKLGIRTLSVLSLIILLVAAIPAPSQAISRSIQTNGISTGPGSHSIGFPPDGPAQALLPTFNISVTVPTGSTPTQTNAKIRDSCDVVLPPEYIVTKTQSNVVTINRTVGTFSMTLGGSVPGQTITEVPTVPMLGPGGATALAALLMASGAFLFGRRKRRAGIQASSEGGPAG